MYYSIRSLDRHLTETASVPCTDTSFSSRLLPKLVKCSSCNIYSCPTQDCTGARIDKLWVCAAPGHSTERSCERCRAQTSSTQAFIKLCTSCQTPFCQKSFVICTGEVWTQSGTKQSLHRRVSLDICPSCYLDSSNPKCHNCNLHLDDDDQKGTPSHGSTSTSSLARARPPIPTVNVGFCEACTSRGTFCSAANHGEEDAEWWCSFCALEFANAECPTCQEETCPRDRRHRCSCGEIDSCRRCAG